MSSDLGIPYAGDRIDEPATRSPACPACGRHSQPEAAFCAFCGTALVHQRIAGPPVFAAVAAAIEGRSAYDVLHEVGGLFESLGAVFEGVSQAPATLVALFPPKEDAAAVAARAALDAASACPDVRLGIDASEVTERSDQDAIWQYLIERSVELQALAPPGTIVPGEEILPLTEGAAVIEPLDDGSGTPSLRALRDLRAAPAEAPTDRRDRGRQDQGPHRVRGIVPERPHHAARVRASDGRRGRWMADRGADRARRGTHGR
ncbi:MAG: zinc ribbon domain-containing protein [Actinobacteria bacterium]|nr:MAG: zinc ribbon domain-containing protein [Actinomycetota bacterium]